MFNLFNKDKKLKVKFVKTNCVVYLDNVAFIHKLNDFVKLSNMTEKEYKNLRGIK